MWTSILTRSGIQTHTIRAISSPGLARHSTAIKSRTATPRKRLSLCPRRFDGLVQTSSEARMANRRHQSSMRTIDSRWSIQYTSSHGARRRRPVLGMVPKQASSTRLLTCSCFLLFLLAVISGCLIWCHWVRRISASTLRDGGSSTRSMHWFGQCSKF